MTEILYYRPADLPDLTRATPGASGFDLSADGACTIAPGKNARIPLGLYLFMPFGIEAQIRGRSGLASRRILSHVGTIDSDYRGECSALLFNHSDDDFHVLVGDRVCQLIFAPVLLPDAVRRESWLDGSPLNFKLRRVPSLSDLPTSERGEGGFGSTGR